jgi:hypothetical protein
VIAPWWTWLGPGLVATAWVCVMLRRGLRRVLRRRAARATPSGPAITERIEAHIAVGSLSGIAPSDIKCHVLLVVTNDGELAVSGTVRGSLRALIVARASAAFAQEAFAAHARDHEREQ